MTISLTIPDAVLIGLLVFLGCLGTVFLIVLAVSIGREQGWLSGVAFLVVMFGAAQIGAGIGYWLRYGLDPTSAAQIFVCGPLVIASVLYRRSVCNALQQGEGG